MTATLSTMYETDRFDTSKVRFIDVDGIHTRVYEAGSGPTLVLFSGGQIGSLYSIDSYSLNLEALAEDLHVIAIDKIGQGATGAPEDDANLTWEATVQHAKRAIEVLGLQAAHLAGHSRGGMLISALSYELADLVKSLVIIDSGTLAPNEPGPNFYGELPTFDKGTMEAARIEPDTQAFKPEQVTDDFMARMLELSKDPAFQRIQARMEGGALFSPASTQRTTRSSSASPPRGCRCPR
jgi:2-hydroxy-6-oxonona-2,4-dienedioate hydrolase